MLWLGQAVVDRGIGERVCGAVGACCLAFFGGLFGGSGGGDWEFSWVSGGEWSFAGVCIL
jgi:hypothetical protein